jgi:hypothetical protein
MGEWGGFCLVVLKEKDRWEVPGIGGEYLNLYLREIGIDGANWIQLAQVRVQWWAVVNMVMNLRVP